MNQQFTRTGFILYVEKYEECVRFYREVLGLEIMFATETPTTFEFGGCYLMVEVDDPRNGVEKPPHDFTCLRMNVPDVKNFAEQIQARGVEVDYQEHTWGTVAKFRDPDGNLCAFKDDEKFEQQVSP